MSEARRRSVGSDKRGASGKSGAAPTVGYELAADNGVNATGAGSASCSPVERKQASGKSGSKSASHDRVRRIVQEEGRTARNLIAWSVPIEDADKPSQPLPTTSGTTAGSTAAAAGPKSSSTSRSPHKRPTAAAGSAREGSPSVARRGAMAVPLPDEASRSSGSRASSATGGRKADLRARYWAFLFDNLKRAVDEIYRTCESDESVDECKEVMLMLEQCIKDFKSLISQWSVLKEYECAEESGKRPTSLAWDLRKTSPGKPYSHDRVAMGGSPGTVQQAPAAAAAAAMHHSLEHPVRQAAGGGGGLQAVVSPGDSYGRTSSWAEKAKGRLDRASGRASSGGSGSSSGGGRSSQQQQQAGPPVRGVDSPRLPTAEPPADTVKPAPIKPGPEDADGWETVRRAKSSKASPCSSVASLSSGRFRKPGTDSECSYSSETATQQGSVSSDGAVAADRSSSDLVAAAAAARRPAPAVGSGPADKPGGSRPIRGGRAAPPGGGRASTARHAEQHGAATSFRSATGAAAAAATASAAQPAPANPKASGPTSRPTAAFTSAVVSQASARNAGGRKPPGVTASTCGSQPLAATTAAVKSSQSCTSAASPSSACEVDAPQAAVTSRPSVPHAGACAASTLPDGAMPSSYRDAALGRRLSAGARPSHSEPGIAREPPPLADTGDKPNSNPGVTCSGSDIQITAAQIETDLSSTGAVDNGEDAKSAGQGGDSPCEASETPGDVKAVVGEVKSVSPLSGTEGTYLHVSLASSLPFSNINTVEDANKEIEPESNAEDADDESLEQELEEAFESALKEEDLLQAELTKEQDQAIESAMMEEASYLEEIKRAEQALSLDATDAELMTGANSADADSLGTSQESQALDWDTMVANYEAEHEKKKALGLTWGDMVDDAEPGSRTPGRGAHLHEKLSSPSRKRSITESKRRYEERQEKARELREKFHSEKTERLKELFRKVEEVRAWKEELLQQRRLSMECKLQSAEAKRSQQLRLKVKKAHEEDNKAHEIAFINSLEAQNKRHEILSRHQGIETRLQDRQGERQKRIDEKAAKEQAAEDRRRALDAERSARLLEMQERRRQREEKIGQQLQEREKERAEVAKVRERERRDRLAALEMQQQTHIKELQKKIQHKQEESAKRHDHNLKLIREKAFVMSIMKHSTEDHNDAPELVPYDTKKLCVVCDVLILSEVHLLSHLRGKKHTRILKEHSCGQDMSRNDIESFNLEHIQDAPGDCPDPRAEQEKERHKTQKKRCKKLRQRMVARGNEYEASLAQRLETFDSPYKAKISKAVKDISKYLQTDDKGPWPQSRVSALERSLGELARVIESKSSQEQAAFRALGGFGALTRVLQLVCDADDTTPVIPLKCAVSACNIIRHACKGFYDNCYHVLFSNRIGILIELLQHRLMAMLPDSKDGIVVSLGGRSASSSSAAAAPSTCTVVHVAVDSVAPAAIQTLTALLACLASHSPSAGKAVTEKATPRGSSNSLSVDAFASRANDVVSYMVSIGIIDKLHSAFTSVRGPLDAEPALAEFIQHGLNLLTAATRLIPRGRSEDISETAKSIAPAAAGSSAGAQATPATAASAGSTCNDATGLMQTFAATELVGIVSLLYSALLGGGRSSLTPEQPPPELPSHTIGVVATGLRLLNHVAGGHLGMLQSVLGEESVSLQFRHIASHLISYCSRHPTNEDVLHETILCVGYFTVLSPDNQALIQTGQPPTVLQQLCLLPFQYFSDPRLVAILYPTLISCCYESTNNRKTVEQELSCELLANYVEEQQLEAQRDRLPSTAGAASASSRKQGPGKEKNAGDVDGRLAFSQRFPRRLWKAAQDYFTTPVSSS